MRYGWFGHYASWQEAKQHCSGYDSERILQKILPAAKKVKNGEAVYERDGVLHESIQYSWPLLANLLWIASQQGNRLSLIDFGGSLGNVFFSNRAYLAGLGSVQWSVVEQQDVVTAGRSAIAGNGLDFFYTVEEAETARGRHDVFLISAALPYFEKPYAFLEETMEKAFPYIIIDNTYFNPVPGDRLTIQKVHPYYYEASYPAWFLDYDKVKALLLKRYELVEEHTNDQFLYLYGEKINYRGFVMKLRT
jgi:putative methyltransferase (TIGR04325 family)